MRQRGFVSIILLIVVLAAIGGAYYLGSKNLLKVSNSPTATSQASSSANTNDASQVATGNLETANWKIYTYKKTGFSFQYPSTWALETGSVYFDKSEDFYIKATGREGTFIMHIYTNPQGLGGGCIDDLIEIPYANETGEVCHIINEDNSETWNGLGKRVGSTVYYGSATANSKFVGKEKSKEVVLKIISTIKFTN